MIEELGIAEADVGYYSGLVDSSFAIAQVLTVRSKLTPSFAIRLNLQLTSSLTRDASSADLFCRHIDLLLVFSF